MKNLKAKICCVVLTIVMVVSVFSGAYAAEDTAQDVVIVSNAAGMTGYYFANYVSGEKTSGITPHNIYDDISDSTVRQFSTNAYYSGGTRGSEPRFYLVNPKSTSASPEVLGNIDYSLYKYLKIAFNVYIGDDDDGIAFRMQRLTSDGIVDTANDYYIGIGGSAYTAGTVTNGYIYSDKSLIPGRWHNVVMILGSTESDVKFYVDNVLCENTIMNKIVSKNATDDKITGFPEGTYGFGGYGNTCIMIPKGKGSSADVLRPYDLRLWNFTMTATNAVYTPDTEAALLNNVVYEMKPDSGFVKKVNTTIEKAEKTAPHFDEKTAIHHYFENFQGASAPGSESGYYTLSSSGGLLGGVDYTKYNNLRIQFNMYIADASNGVYFRARRATNGTSEFRKDNYLFNIGGADFNYGTAGSGTTYNYVYNGIETHRWHNVVMEIGANSSNTDVKFYVDGQLVLDAEDDKQMASDVYGFGGESTNWAFVALNADAGKNLDMYLSDFKMIASNTVYNPENVPVPHIVPASSDVGIDGETIYTSQTLNKDSFIAENTDSLYISDKQDMVVLYNALSGRVKYYDVVNGGFHIKNMNISNVGTEINVFGDIYNFTGNPLTPYTVAAAYKYNENMLPVLCGVDILDNVTYENGINEFSQNMVMPESEYDFMKVIFMNKNFAPLTGAYVAGKEPLDVLVIGCSFSVDSVKYVHKIAESMGVDINVHHYFHSGGTVSSHYASLDKTTSADRNADNWYYALNDNQSRYTSVNPGVTNPTLATFLEENQMDAVILQNYWSKSEQIAQYEAPEDYTPDLDGNGKEYRTYYPSPYYVKLAEYIKEKQPDTQILINGIWSNEQGYYMADYVTDNYAAQGFENESAFMYDLIEKYNGQSAIDVGATVLQNGATIGKDGGPVVQLPVGYAVQYARNYTDEKGERIFFTEKNPDDYKGWEAGQLYPAPVYEGKIRLSRDGFHLSPAGRYLAGCVWVEMLTGADVRNAAFKPEYDDSFSAQALDETGATVNGKANYYYEEMDSETAALIRTIAHEAVAKFKSQSVRGLEDPSLEF